MTMIDEVELDEELMPVVERVDRDMKKAASLLTERQARYLVDLYYQMQDNRKRSDRQAATAEESGEPSSVVAWVTRQSETLEDRIRLMMGHYSMSRPIGEWSRGVCGIGPVLAAGLMAYMDINKAPTVGHIWRFAGLDPTCEWKKGEKRPWSAGLKVLCWKIGESFVKVSTNSRDIYGKVYIARKKFEQAMNEADRYADQAKAKLERFKIGKSTEAYGHYSAGKLPPAHIQSRAKRYAVKLFLSHWHEKAYEFAFGKKPPAPYIIGREGHTDYVSADEAARLPEEVARNFDAVLKRL